MSAAGRSVFFFGIYLLVLGIIVVAIPNTLLAVLGLPAVTDVWIRVVGVLVIVIGFYYLQAGRTNLNDFYLWTIIARAGEFLACLVFVLLGLVNPIFIVLGAIDLGGAVWTFFALQVGV